MTKKRNRSRPAGSFESRLQKFADDARRAARAMHPGAERDSLLQKALQTERAMDVTAMLKLRHGVASK
jgi:hypothetical protein